MIVYISCIAPAAHFQDGSLFDQFCQSAFHCCLLYTSVIRLIVKDKVDLIEQCLERKDLKAADYHVETLKHTVDLLIKEVVE